MELLSSACDLDVMSQCIKKKGKCGKRAAILTLVIDFLVTTREDAWTREDGGGGITLFDLIRLVEGPPVIDCIVEGSVNLEGSSKEPPPKLPICVDG